MEKLMMKNTYNAGVITFIMYPTNEGTLLLACKELCLILEGTDEEALRLKMLGDAKRYILEVCGHKLGEHLLNQELPDEIMKEFTEYRLEKANENFQQWKMTVQDILSNRSTRFASKRKILC